MGPGQHVKVRHENFYLNWEEINDSNRNNTSSAAEYRYQKFSSPSNSYFSSTVIPIQQATLLL